MSNEPAVRSVRRPPQDFAQLTIPITRQPAQTWHRVHRLGHPARFFSLNSNHRFSHKDCPYRVLYLAADVDTCLFERFGDNAYDQGKTIARSLWQSHGISRIHVSKCNVCDLTQAKTLSAIRVDLSALLHHELSTPQEWGKAIQLHPLNFQGLKYKSRFDGKTCLALFQRDGVETELEEELLHALPEHSASLDWLDKHEVSLY